MFGGATSVFGQSQQQQQQQQPASTFGEFYCTWKLCHNVDIGHNMLTSVCCGGVFYVYESVVEL